MFPYERFNHTLTMALTNNQHPEISAIKEIELQWLIAMLGAPGFLAPFQGDFPQKHNACSHFSTGRYNPISRPATEEEKTLIQHHLGVTTNDVTVYHYAKVGSSTYQDTTIEKEIQREQTNIVEVNDTVCSIMHFMSVDINNIIYELVAVRVLGQPQLCEDSQCRFTGSQEIPQPAMFNVNQLSPPIVHAYENDMLCLM